MTDAEVYQFGTLITDPDPSWIVPIGSPAGGQAGHVSLANVVGPVVRKFPFAFDTPNLLTGATVYTPTVGDLILDAWVEVVTVWDGTSPIADIGLFGLAGPPAGLAATAINGTSIFDLFIVDSAATNGVLNQTAGSGASLLSVQGPSGSRVVPAKFVTTDPLQVIVTQSGVPGGANPGSTQGTALLYIITVTPS